jgi:hypothetical protein
MATETKPLQKSGGGKSKSAAKMGALVLDKAVMGRT